MELMSDEEWQAIQGDPKLPPEKTAELYAARWGSTLDWDNLRPEDAEVLRKTLRDNATELIVKKDIMPVAFFMTRPCDVVLP